MNTTPLVSIVMAVKDTAPYLEACLNSIIDQRYVNWELIAVNDHSSDATPTILQNYSDKDPRIRVFDAKGHRLIPTLQEAYARVSGTLINRMDSDDMMPDDKLEVLVTKWLKHGRGTIIAGGTRHFVDEGEVGDGFIKYEQWLNEIARSNTHYAHIYKECVVPSHCWIIHKDDFDQAGAFDPVVYPEDYDLCFRFYQSGLDIVGIDKVLHFWRDRSNRISRTWEEYKDNRYFELKLRYFYQLDRDKSRPLVIWGAGKNGKDLVRLLQDSYESELIWVCDNPKKIGKDIYGITLDHHDIISELDNPQILLTVSAPEGITEIQRLLVSWQKEVVRDYWHFL